MICSTFEYILTPFLFALGSCCLLKQSSFFSMPHHFRKPITTHCHILMHSRYTAVENIVRKGEIACYKQFLLFSQCFLPFKMSSAICFNLDQSKILWFDKGLIPVLFAHGSCYEFNNHHFFLYHTTFVTLTLDSVDQDQIAQNVQSDL